MIIDVFSKPTRYLEFASSDKKVRGTARSRGGTRGYKIIVVGAKTETFFSNWLLPAGIVKVNSAPV